MFTLIACLFLMFVLMVTAILQRTYNTVPRKELKRHAAKGDQLASVLYRAVAHDSSLRLLLYIIAGLSSAELFLLLNHLVHGVVAFLVLVILVVVSYIWLPNGTAGPVGARIAIWFTPIILWLLERLHPALDYIYNFINKYRQVSFHTKMYEKEDILELLSQQKTQSDNRIPDEEITIAVNALTYGEKLVREVMTPKKVVKTVKADDSIGPILMAELHDSGFSRFPVIKGEKIVGTLYLHDLVGATQGGKVKDTMNSKVFYVNEESKLSSVFHALMKTQHHLFVAVNNFEEIVGVISIEDVLEQIIGKPIVDEFDQYDDLRAVAAKLAEKEKHEHATEVVE